MSDVISAKYCFYNEIPIPEHLTKMLTEKEKPYLVSLSKNNPREFRSNVMQKAKRQSW
ncbi:MAG: hypothetical protein H0Z35_03205 [Thermoanaerobacteraceae bacterium]|nr:hypothetical protein [Thermoanaerobacteraceae bacterium]